MQGLFPQRDLVGSEQDQVVVRKKLATDPAVAFQRNLLEIRALSCLKQGLLQDAFACADLLEDIELQVKILGSLGGD